MGRGSSRRDALDEHLVLRALIATSGLSLVDDMDGIDWRSEVMDFADERAEGVVKRLASKSKLASFGAHLGHRLASEPRLPLDLISTDPRTIGPQESATPCRIAKVAPCLGGLLAVGGVDARPGHSWHGI